MIAPILDEIADEYSDRLKITKLDIDANQGTPPKYGIRGIPTLMLFKNGEVEATKVGALSKSQLRHSSAAIFGISLEYRRLLYALFNPVASNFIAFCVLTQGAKLH